MDKDGVFEEATELGVEGLRVELFYSYFSSSSYEHRKEWIEECQDELNDFLDGKSVYSMEMDFAGEDKDRIYGSIIYQEE